MSRIDKLIQEFCPKGVERLEISKICKTISTGKQRNRDTLSKVRTPEMQYPVINGGISPSGYTDEFNTKEDTITISQGGASAGFVSFIQEPFWSGAHCYTVEPDDTEIILNRFLYFFLKDSEKILMDRAMGAGIPGLNRKALNSLKIPIPPLEVQKEIVSILDKFTQLEAELSAELDARRKQYEYYREELMTFGDDVEKALLGEVGEVTKLAGYEFTAHIKYANEGTIIALRGLNVKKGRLDLSSVKYIDQSNFAKLSRSKLYVNDMLFTYVGTIGEVALIDEDDRYYLAPNVARIRFTDERINPVFMRYYFQTQKFTNKQINRYLSESSMKNLTMENIRKFEVPLPDLSEQERIVALLDKFNALVSDITIGLPAEINARHQQYEYYRTKLLTFQELPA